MPAFNNWTLDGAVRHRICTTLLQSAAEFVKIFRKQLQSLIMNDWTERERESAQ